MKIRIEEAQVGNRIEFSVNQENLYSGRILEKGVRMVKTDYMDENTQHKRNKWILFENITPCETSDIPEAIKDALIETLKTGK